MAIRSLVLAAVVGVAAAGAFLPAAAQSRGSLSISIGAPAPYYGPGYGYGYDDRYGYGHRYAHPRHRAGHVWVPAHWVATHRGRVWVPGQYVPVRGYVHRPGYGQYGYPGHHGGAQVIYRSGPTRVVPRGYYPPGYLSPYEDRRRRGW